MKNARGLLCKPAEAFKCRLLLVLLLFWKDKITEVSAFEDESIVNFEVGTDQRTSVIRDFEIIYLAGLIVEVMDDKRVVDNLHPNQ